MILLSAYRIRKYWLLLMGLVGQKTGGKGGKKEHSEDKTILKVTITKHSLFMSTKDCPGETNQYQRLHSLLCNTPQRCHPTESLHIQPKHHPSIRTDTTITVCCATHYKDVVTLQNLCIYNPHTIPAYELTRRLQFAVRHNKAVVTIHNCRM